MQALPAIQSLPPTQDTQPSSAANGSATNGNGTDFKTMLQSSSANASNKADPTAPQAPGEKNNPQETAVQPPLIPIAAAIDVKQLENSKSAKKEDPKKEAKTDSAVAPAVTLPVDMPMQGIVSQSPPVKDQPAADKSKPVDLKNEPTQSESRPATIAQVGNNLPQKEIKTSFSQAMNEKGILPETKKVSGGETTLQPAAIAETGAAKSTPKVTVEAPVSSPQWGSEVGQKITWMSASGNHVAELHLNPPNLGPLEVKLSINNDQATIQFVSQHQEVRTAIESALPKLREMMMDSGISLGNASVDSGSFQQSNFNQQERPRQSFFSGNTLQQQSISTIRVGRLTGKVDTFV